MLPLVSDWGEPNLKHERAALDASALVKERLLGGEERSGPFGILCLETSGEVVGLGLELSSWPEWSLLFRSAGLGLG